LIPLRIAWPAALDPRGRWWSTLSTSRPTARRVRVTD
jgi:hypothetical protein